jgi:hypothetical protein
LAAHGSLDSAAMSEIAQATVDVILVGLEHGIDSVRDGGPLIPFVITERRGKRAVARFAAETLEAGIDAGVAAIRADPPEPGDVAALVYDGYLTLPEGERFDAIYAEALDGEGVVTVMAQAYRPKRFLRGLETIGEPAYFPEAKGKL